jgi:hypothetical protein
MSHLSAKSHYQLESFMAHLLAKSHPLVSAVAEWDVHLIPHHIVVTYISSAPKMRTVS